MALWSGHVGTILANRECGLVPGNGYVNLPNEALVPGFVRPKPVAPEVVRLLCTEYKVNREDGREFPAICLGFSSRV